MFNFGRTHKPLPTKIAARDSERRWHSLGAHACGREKWGLTRHALLLPLGPGQRVCRSAPTQSVPQDMLCHPPVRHCSVQSVRKHVARAETSCATADFPLVIVEAGGGDARDLVNVETVRLFLHLVGVGVGAVPEVDHGESVGVAILHHDRIISSDGCVGLAHVGMKQLSRGLCCQLSDYYLAARSGKGAELGHARGVVRRSELRYVRSMQKIVRLEDDVKLPDPNKHRSTDTVVVSRPQVERPQMALTRCLSPPPSLDYFGRWAVRG